jgi:iron complex outermembrane receptor protein
MYSFKRDRFSPDKSGKYEEGEGPVESFNCSIFRKLQV